MTEFNWAAATPEGRRAHWVTKLRSPEYQQTKSVLRAADNRFCCLGVLCDLADASRWQDPGITRFTYAADGMFHDTMPPSSVLESVGLHADQGEELANRNDEGETFEQIAARIEQANYELATSTD